MQDLEQLQKQKSIFETKEIHLSVLKSLAYSEVFSYPLRIEEIVEGMTVASQRNKVESALKDLVHHKMVFKSDEFYSLSHNDQNFKLRLERNDRAKKYLKWGFRISKFIGMFPFVRGVFISGSLSKNSMDEDSDIDYFVITEEGHLWTCRTILILFKKLFLFNSYKLFCLNYFLDTSNLEVKDENAYIAREINTLIPTYGRQYCAEFFSSNSWTKNFLPNKKTADPNKVKESNVRGIKWVLEKFLSGQVGHIVEMKSMSLSKAYWRKKFKHLNKEELSAVSVSRKDISSHHPDNFKTVVLNRRTIILNEMERKFDIKF